MISVIVPVYNAAPHLSQCVQSIVDQSYADWELLLIDDGSTDQSADICRAWTERDARIRMRRQPNQGASAARNHALDLVQGEFVAFVDADDVVHHRYLELLLQAMTSTGADVVQSPYIIISAREREAFGPARLSQELMPCPQQSMSGEEALLSMLYQRGGGVNSSPCKLYRREVFTQVRFPVQWRVYEDLYLLAQLLPRVNKVVCLAQPLYFYFKETSGTLSRLSMSRLDAFELLETLEAQFLVQGHRDWVRAVRERRLSVAFHTLRLLASQPHTDAHRLMAHHCWQQIRTLRPESLHDGKARLKNRLVAAASYLLTLFSKRKD